MQSPVSDGNMNNTILNQVQEGMRVCDSAGNEIGKVRKVFLGVVSEQADQRGGGSATARSTEFQEDSLQHYLAEAFGSEPLPETLRERLLRSGFIRIDSSGLFASDRFVLPDQIESVADDCIRLRLTKDELIKP